MRIAFLYNRAAEDPTKLAEDDDPARSPVVAALRRLGHEVTSIACTLDLQEVRQQLERLEPELAFNRVESLGGSDAMAVAVAMLLDVSQIPYTGCQTEALVAAANKIGVKKQLVRAGLPTPEWIAEDFGLPAAADKLLGGCGLGTSNPQSRVPSECRNPKFIFKSIYEHASFEIDDTAVVESAAVDEIVELVRNRSAITGKPFFAERFIEGREFNLSLLGEPPEVLPPTEIDFAAFPPTKPRIVGYGAKWTASSFEFQNTPRIFDFLPADGPLIRRLTDLALGCWRLFGLRGYARIDFRVDSFRQPWILEINTNPCLAPTAGFAAALQQAGFSYDEGIRRIVEAASAPHTRSHGRLACAR